MGVNIRLSVKCWLSLINSEIVQQKNCRLGDMKWPLSKQTVLRYKLYLNCGFKHFDMQDIYRCCLKLKPYWRFSYTLTGFFRRAFKYSVIFWCFRFATVIILNYLLTFCSSLFASRRFWSNKFLFASAFLQFPAIFNNNFRESAFGWRIAPVNML